MSPIDRARLLTLHQREEKRFVADHPRSAELYLRAQRSLLGGVPLNSSLRWHSQRFSLARLVRYESWLRSIREDSPHSGAVRFPAQSALRSKLRLFPLAFKSVTLRGMY